MAESAVSFLLDSLTQVIIQEADLLRGAEVEIRGIEAELERLALELERVQVPADQSLKYTNIIRDSEDLIDAYGSAASEMRRAAIYKKPLYLLKQRRSKLKLKKHKDKIPEVTRALLNEKFPQREDRQDGVNHYMWRYMYYFLLFPANFQVPTRRLIALWVAEGLITNTDGKNVEEIAEDHLNELIKEELIVATKKKLNGKVQTCSLAQGIRDKWLTEAKKANFFQSRRKKLRRLVVEEIPRGHAESDINASFIQFHGKRSVSGSMPDYGGVISLISFDTREGSESGEFTGDFLNNCVAAEHFSWLKILDLEKVFRPKLPATMGKLVRLKYLGLRWTYLQHLPHFVNRLRELQVLDVKHTYISVLPSSIWKMVDLRHLYLSETYRTRFPDRPSQQSVDRPRCLDHPRCLECLDKMTHDVFGDRPTQERVYLTRLQTLWGAFIDEDTHVVKGLDTLGEIRKLGVSCRPTSACSNMSKQLEAVANWISKLEQLLSLRLKSQDNKGNVADLHLTTLEPNRKLSTVYLLGKLNPQVVDKFPHTLTDVTLSGSELNVDPMEFLGRLPKLQILRLLSKSVVHHKLHCFAGGFRELKLIHIWCLEDLKEWQVEEGSLPCLENFEIRSCPQLNNLSPQLQSILTLEKIWLTNMSQIFMEEVKLKYPQLWAKIRFGSSLAGGVSSS